MEEANKTMGSIRVFTGFLLAVVSTFAVAELPYEINGLHTGLMFTDAVAAAETLGGSCNVSTSRKKDRGINAQCEFLPCLKRNSAAACEQYDLESPGPKIASQPILQIGLEAAGEASGVTRIAFLFEGDIAAVAAGLEREFGAPFDDGRAARENSWTTAHRWHWKRGQYRLGLLNNPTMVMLTVDPGIQTLNQEAN